MTDSFFCRFLTLAALLLVATQVVAQRSGDYIAAVVNEELVTAGEVQQRIDRIKQDAARSGVQLPLAGMLRRQVLDALIDERIQLSHARNAGSRVEDAEVDRALAGIAAQNQLTGAQFQERLQNEGMALERFRSNLRDQMLVERAREREVGTKMEVTEREVDALLGKQRAATEVVIEYNIAQILIAVAEDADEETVAERQGVAEFALAEAQAGKAFEQLAREFSDDENKTRGGEMGLRPANRWPEAFVAVVRRVKSGDVVPSVLRTGAGFHVLKLLDRREGAPFPITQTRVRHILLRPSAKLSPEVALGRLMELKRQIEAGTKAFEQAARELSEDASAARGGDLGWTSPGSFVPEFEETMDAMAIAEIADPFVSRFGVHLVQVLARRKASLDPKQLRERARNLLRERKLSEAYSEWARNLRARAYVELRDPPP